MATEEADSEVEDLEEVDMEVDTEAVEPTEVDAPTEQAHTAAASMVASPTTITTTMAASINTKRMTAPLLMARPRIRKARTAHQAGRTTNTPNPPLFNLCNLSPSSCPAAGSSEDGIGAGA